MNYNCEICAVIFDSSHVCNKIVDLMESPESNDRTKSRLDLPKTSSHEGKKPFKCEICGKSFTKNQNLTKHIGSIHEGANSFQCDICDYSSSRKDSMNRHVASVHEGKKAIQM